MLTPSNLIAHGAIARIVCTLERAGVFGELKKTEKGMQASDMAKNLSLNERTLEALCDFLALHTPNILEKKESTYLLGDQFEDISMQNNLFFLLAYEPVFDNLTDLLTGKHVYGKDVSRNGEYLRVSSGLYNSLAWDALIEELKRMEINTVIDLGANAGDFLGRIKKTFPRMRCIGVDIDPDVVELSKKEEGVVEVYHGDVAKPSEIQKIIPEDIDLEHTMFTGITVWHEFLREDTHTLQDVFTEYKSLFAGAFFAVVEYNGFSFDDLLKMEDVSLKEAASVYQLVHPLTNQGIPQPPEVWRDIFRSAAIELKTEMFVRPNSTLYIGTL